MSSKCSRQTKCRYSILTRSISMKRNSFTKMLKNRRRGKRPHNKAQEMKELVRKLNSTASMRQVILGNRKETQTCETLTHQTLGSSALCKCTQKQMSLGTPKTMKPKRQALQLRSQGETGRKHRPTNEVRSNL